MEGHVPPLGRVLRIGSSLIGHEPGLGLLDQSVDGGGTDGVGERSDLGIHEGCCLRRERHRLLRDPTSPPHRHLACDHTAVQAREAVLQLQPVGHQEPTGIGRHPQRDRELGDAELRHQRCTLARQREPGLPTDPCGAGPDRCIVDRVHRVLLGPDRRRREDVDLGGVGVRPASADEPEHLTGSVQLLDDGGGALGDLHESSQPVGTDSFDSVSEDVDNFSRRLSQWFRDARWRSLLNHRGRATEPTTHSDDRHHSPASRATSRRPHDVGTPAQPPRTSTTLSDTEGAPTRPRLRGLD